jgi:nucleoside-diphosphate-sugar epimerase
MKLILGAKGRLGQALCSALGADEFVAPAREVYAPWWQAGMTASIGRYLDIQAPAIDTIFIAAGLIDPQVPALEHHRVNLLMPQHVIEAAMPRGIRVLTLGTMMEVLSKEIPAEGYVASKAALAAHVGLIAEAHANVLHVRIHTLYGGGMPSPFMFAGQMLNALTRREPFAMSPGTQLREYHHVDDEAAALCMLAASKLAGVVDLNHGDAISLAELARTTFAAFGCTHLLEIGALPAPDNEHPSSPQIPTPGLPTRMFRDVRSAMIDYLEGCLSTPGTAP